jgi:lipopolysaccharide/colanic/teichoic acid biosynthesis glycosyltransferase
MLKRAFDIAVVLAGAVLTLPLAALICAAILLSDGRPILFRQSRVGRFGVKFQILKFRTMVVDAPALGPSVTAEGDARVTALGRFLRRWKLDELPQLWNVVRGDMSLVGPRPEVPEFVALYPTDVRDQVLSVRPGITDETSLQYRHESKLLRGASDPRATYVEEIMPAKLRSYVEYVRHRSLWGDIRILVATARRVLAG